MAISSYPAGFKGGALVKEVPVFDSISGNVFWVSSGTGGAGNPGTFNRPLSTIAGALAKCQASNGDRIFLKPGHAESITAAAGIALNVAGVTIVGLGQGSSRPTITWSATAATMTVSASNIKVENVIFKAGIDAVVIGVNMLAGSTDLWFDRCAWYEGASTFNWVTIISSTLVANAHDGLTITRNEVVTVDTGCGAFVFVGDNMNRFVFEDNMITMGVNDAAGVIMQTAAKNQTALSCQRNRIYRANIASTAESADIFIGNTATTNTGIICDNYVGHLDPLAESIFNVTGVLNFNNYSCGVVDKSGYLIPAVDS